MEYMVNCGELMLKCCNLKMYSYNKSCFSFAVLLSCNDVCHYMSSDIECFDYFFGDKK